MDENTKNTMAMIESVGNRRNRPRCSLGCIGLVFLGCGCSLFVGVFIIHGLSTLSVPFAPKPTISVVEWILFAIGYVVAILGIAAGVILVCPHRFRIWIALFLAALLAMLAGFAIIYDILGK